MIGLQINGIDLLQTFKCNAKCRHCVYRAGPERHERMDVQKASDWLAELVEFFPIQTLTVHGGEPTLFFNDLCSIIGKARELGIDQRGIITNGSWATDEMAAITRLRALKDSGLTRITFSLDAFHLEYIHLELIKNGISAATHCDFEKVCVDSYVINQERLNNPYDIRTKESLLNIGYFEGVEFSMYPVGFEGRASDKLTQYREVHKSIPSGPCKAPFWLGRSLGDPKVVEVDPEGNVTLCPGISIGNVEKSSIAEVFEEYEHNLNPIVSVIVEKGPKGLYEMAIQRGYRKHTSFVDECHLCYEMRRFLRPYYEDILNPSSCYQI